MSKPWQGLLNGLLVLMLLGVGSPVPTRVIAQPEATQLTTSGVYEDDFSTYTVKDYVDHTIWDPWGHVLRLARPDGETQRLGAVAIDGSNNTFVVWADNRNGNWDIYAQKMDASGNRLWYTDVLVNSESGAFSPAVAVDQSGNAIVVWQDDRNDNSDIYAQKIGASGNRLWAIDVRVNSDTGTATQNTPAVATDGSGNFYVVWMDYRNNDGDIYVQRLDGNGNKLWLSDIRVNSDVGTSAQWNPAVAADQNGNLVAVWQDERNGNWDIYAQKINTNTNRLWVTDVRVNSDGGTAFQGFPTIAVDGSSNIVIGWEDNRNGNGDIYAQKISVIGNRLWATDIRVNSDTGTIAQWDVSMVSDKDGVVVVVWQETRNDTRDVYAQKLDSSGDQLWVVDVRVNADTAMTPAVAMDNSGNAIIVWEDWRGSVDICAQKIDPSGSRLWSIHARVNMDSGTTFQKSPALVVDGSGNTTVVWEDYRNGLADIYVCRLDNRGNKLWLVDLRVSSNLGQTDQRKPVIAADNNSNTIIVWEDYRNGSDGDIYAQRLDSEGNRLWAADVRVNSDNSGATQSFPAVAVDGNGNAVVVWRDGRNGNQDIYAQKLNANGNRLWVADIRVNSDIGAATQSFPDVATDESGNLVVVWEDYRNGNLDIFMQKINVSGNRIWGADLRVNADTGGMMWQRSPAVAVNGNSNTVVVWHNHNNSNGDEDFYSQWIDANGNRLLPTDMRVHSEPRAAGYSPPTVAMDMGGNAILVWQDTRNNYDYDIYAQKMDIDGNRLWAADMRVNSDIGVAGQATPVVAVDGSGNAVIVWEDNRHSNADIYSQKLNQIGGKGWLADLQVVYPDLFYFPTGTVQSRTVDTLVADITQATLTIDMTLNGGSVQFYLTNNGGTAWAAVTPGVTHVFTTTGSDLRWRAVLTSDPLWRHRSPVVNNLRIEYSSQILNTDDYEPDDTCAQARPVAVNGALQAHTLHQYADADWIWFEVAAGKDYVVQATAIESNADLKLELYDQCGQPPVPPDDEDTLGNDARLVFTAPVAGVYYIKATNTDPLSYGADTEYRLSVRVQQAAPLVVIVAGRNNSGSLDANIRFMGDQAYRTFRRLGVPRENLRYLSVGANRDADQDGYQDVDGVPSWLNTRYAIQDWPRERGLGLGVPFYLYLVDHGGTDYYCALSCTDYAAETLKERVSAADLHLWLSNLEATTGADEINVIIEACHSGSFIDVTSYGLAHISGHNRVIIASTGSDKDAYPSEHGGYFSDAFFTTFGDNADLWTAYEAGRTATQRKPQTPWLDDNGDAVADGRDGALARGRGLLALGEGSIPIVQNLTVSEVQDASATLQMIALDDVAVVTATVEIFPPGFTIPEVPEGETPVLNIERVRLSATGNGTFEGAYTGFTEQGIYRLVAYVWDSDGNLSLPHLVVVGDVQVFLPLVLRN